jgi:hypothetical protein
MQHAAYAWIISIDVKSLISGRALRVRRKILVFAVLDALHRLDLDVGFLVAGKIDVGEDQQCLRAIGDIKRAMKAHLTFWDTSNFHTFIDLPYLPALTFQPNDRANNLALPHRRQTRRRRDGCGL